MFWIIFSNLCKENHISPNGLAKNLNFSSGSITHWKNGKVPHHNTLIKIADYFGVSVDYLLGKEEREGRKPLHFDDGSQVLNRSKLHAVPLYDSVSAGLGTLALDEAIEHIPLYIDNADEARRTFCVNVKGNSMSPKIEDGDIIQIVKQDTVDVGKIAVVLIDGTEAVVKQVVYTDESVELRSFNPFFPSRFFKKEEIDRIKIVGVVKKIIKSV